PAPAPARAPPRGGAPPSPRRAPGRARARAASAQPGTAARGCQIGNRRAAAVPRRIGAPGAPARSPPGTTTMKLHSILLGALVLAASPALLRAFEVPSGPPVFT